MWSSWDEVWLQIQKSAENQIPKKKKERKKKSKVWWWEQGVQRVVDREGKVTRNYWVVACVKNI